MALLVCFYVNNCRISVQTDLFRYFPIISKVHVHVVIQNFTLFLNRKKNLFHTKILISISPKFIFLYRKGKYGNACLLKK